MVVEAVERIHNKQIQVSSFNYFRFHWKLTSSVFKQLELEAIVMMPEPLLVPWDEKEPEVSSIHWIF